MEEIKNIYGVLIAPEDRTAKTVTINDTLDEYYKNLNCYCVDMVERKIGNHKNKLFNIICDDNGLLMDDPKISAIDSLGTVMLVGNLLVTGLSDDEGNLTSLTKKEAEYILERCQIIPTHDHPEGLMMLTQCEYDR